MVLAACGLCSGNPQPPGTPEFGVQSPLMNPEGSEVLAKTEDPKFLAKYSPKPPWSRFCRALLLDSGNQLGPKWLRQAVTWSRVRVIGVFSFPVRTVTEESSKITQNSLAFLPGPSVQKRESSSCAASLLRCGGTSFVRSSNFMLPLLLLIKKAISMSATRGNSLRSESE